MNTVRTSVHQNKNSWRGMATPQNKSIVRPSQDTFFQLLGGEVLIACQLHLDYIERTNGNEPSAKIFKEYQGKGLAFKDPSKQRVQIFEPRDIIASGDPKSLFTEDWRATILFSGKNRSIAKYAKLVFKRRKGAWMCCARENENLAFGFSLECERDPHHMHLAYPGISGHFEALFIKIQKPGKDGFAYYRITAEDAGEHNDVLVNAIGISEEKSPHALVTPVPMAR